MKKFIPFALATAVVAGACGGSSNHSSTGSSSPSGGSSSSSSSSSAAAGSTPASSAASGGSSTSPSTANPSSSVTLTESGSSLLYPFLQDLITPLSKAYPNVKLSPAAGGSGKGISDATSGISNMGGSDAYLTAKEYSQGLASIPIAVSSQDVYVNLPGVKSLKLSGPVLSKIYQGKVTTWNDPSIAKLNPGVTLPSTKIVPVHRSDSSGDTFIFTGFLSKADPSGWGAGPGQGTTVTWPSVASALTGHGNPGMVSTCKSSPGCVAYIGISAQDKADAAGLTKVELQDRNGDFLTATPTTVTNAVNSSLGNVAPNLKADLLYAPGKDSYPIVNFEYLIVKPKQSNPNTALAIRDFLSFAISPSGGSAPSLLAKPHFQPLPSSVVPKVDSAIAAIK